MLLRLNFRMRQNTFVKLYNKGSYMTIGALSHPQPTTHIEGSSTEQKLNVTNSNPLWQTLKKIGGTVQKVLFATTLGLVISKNAPLEANPKTVESEYYINALIDEARGLYQNALKMAKSSPQHNEIDFINRLENEVLTLGSSRIICNKDFKPRTKLIQLLQILECDISSQLATIEKINEWAQANLLRQGERWQAQSNKFEKYKEEILPFLHEFVLIDEVNPSFKHYEEAIIHGASLSTMRLRLQFLIEQWEKGVRFDSLSFLTGARPLDPAIENEISFRNAYNSAFKIRSDWQLTNLPTTEAEAAQMIWDQAEMAEEMRMIKVTFVNAPMKMDEKTGKQIRPNTDDTVYLWKKNLDKLPSKVLAISNQPYVNRQDLVVRSIIPNLPFETVGPKANDQEIIALFLDELARIIYQTKKAYETFLKKS